MVPWYFFAERALPIFGERAHDLVGKSLRGSVSPKNRRVPDETAAHRSDPESSVAALQEGRDVVALELRRVLAVEDGKRTPSKRAKPSSVPTQR